MNVCDEDQVYPKIDSQLTALYFAPCEPPEEVVKEGTSEATLSLSDYFRLLAMATSVLERIELMKESTKDIKRAVQRLLRRQKVGYML